MLFTISLPRSFGHMKKYLLIIIALFFITDLVFAQEKQSNRFRTSSQTSISYVFALNEHALGGPTNALQVKLMLGKANERVGFGIGIENTNYRGTGSNFDVLGFSANAHLLAKAISTDETNFFIKGAIGYAPRIFRTYNKGFFADAAGGLIFTTKRKSKYFVQAIYRHQQVEGFMTGNVKPEIHGLGAGVGTWF